MADFILDTDTLSGGQYLHRFDNTIEGRFREVQLQVTQAVVNQDVELHGLGVLLENLGVSGENP